LATEDGQTHIICMPNVTKEQIDEFIEDVVAHPVDEVSHSDIW